MFSAEDIFGGMSSPFGGLGGFLGGMGGGRRRGPARGDDTVHKLKLVQVFKCVRSILFTDSSGNPWLVQLFLPPKTSWQHHSERSGCIVHVKVSGQSLVNLLKHVGVSCSATTRLALTCWC